MIINFDDANQGTQANWQEALTDAHCPTCLQRVRWTSPHAHANSGTAPRMSVSMLGECCGVTYSLTSIDQPASDHTQLFGIIKRIEP